MGGEVRVYDVAGNWFDEWTTTEPGLRETIRRILSLATTAGQAKCTRTTYPATEEREDGQEKPHPAAERKETKMDDVWLHHYDGDKWMRYELVGSSYMAAANQVMRALAYKVGPVGFVPAEPPAPPSPSGPLTREEVAAFAKRVRRELVQWNWGPVGVHAQSAVHRLEALAAVMFQEEATREKPKAE